MSDLKSIALKRLGDGELENSPIVANCLTSIQLRKQPMEPKTVEILDEKIEESFAEIIIKLSLKKLPLLPSRQTSSQIWN